MLESYKQMFRGHYLLN